MAATVATGYEIDDDEIDRGFHQYFSSNEGWSVIHADSRVTLYHRDHQPDPDHGDVTGEEITLGWLLIREGIRRRAGNLLGKWLRAVRRAAKMRPAHAIRRNGRSRRGRSAS